MGKPSKIEKHGCQEIVAAGQRANKSLSEIAKECSEWAGEPISKMAVQRYIESLPEKKKEVVVESEKAIVNIVHQDFNIIQTSLQMTERMMQRFDFVDRLPEYFNERMDEIMHTLIGEGDVEGGVIQYLENWQREFTQELHRKVDEISKLNREVRENMKFVVHLRDKAFEFDLTQDYLSLFMNIFRSANLEAFDVAMRGVQSNPRMMKIVEQQQFRIGKQEVSMLDVAQEQADRDDEGGDRRAKLLGDLRAGIEDVRAAHRPRAH